MPITVTTIIKRSWDILTEEQREKAINEIISFFRSERNEEIGVIATGNILDMFLQTTGIDLYNKGIDDSNDFLKCGMKKAKWIWRQS